MLTGHKLPVQCARVNAWYMHMCITVHECTHTHVQSEEEVTTTWRTVLKCGALERLSQGQLPAASQSWTSPQSPSDLTCPRWDTGGLLSSWHSLFLPYFRFSCYSNDFSVDPLSFQSKQAYFSNNRIHCLLFVFPILLGYQTTFKW